MMRHLCDISFHYLMRLVMYNQIARPFKIRQDANTHGRYDVLDRLFSF